MYYHIEGILAHKEQNIAVIDCGGVGYKLIISSTTAANLPNVGEKAKLYTHLVVKEDLLEIIGFIDQFEKNAFLMLLSVSGVGIKVAMAVLSALTAERFAYAVASGDYKEISIAHGVSTKTAQKIIIELKDKISKDQLGSKSASGARASVNTGDLSNVKSSNVSDALNALMVLAYSKHEALEALKGEDPNQPLEKLIKAALKKLSK